MIKKVAPKITTTNLSNEIKGKTLFEKIKQIQSLPDEIISEFLNSKGSLSTTNYKSKFSPHAK